MNKSADFTSEETSNSKERIIFTKKPGRNPYTVIAEQYNQHETFESCHINPGKAEILADRSLDTAPHLCTT
jgi:hypothetical protein